MKIKLYAIILAVMFFIGCTTLPAGETTQDNSTATHYERGAYFQSIDKPVLALSEFKRALETSPHHVKSLNGIGISYDMLNEYTNAVNAYQKALNYNTGTGLDYTWNNLGYSHFLAGDIDKAVECFQKAIQLNDNEKYRNNLEIALSKKSEITVVKVEPIVETPLKPAKKEVLKDHEWLKTPVIEEVPIVPIVVKKGNGKTFKIKLPTSPPTPLITIRKKDNVEIIYADVGIEKNFIFLMKENLKAEGYNVTLVQAVATKYRKSWVSHIDGYVKQANNIAKIIPGKQSVRHISRFGRAGVNIQVVLGKNMITKTMSD